MSIDYSTQRVVAFDTLKYVKRLKAAGVPDPQAEAEAEALAEVLAVHLGELATKRDLKDQETVLRRDIQELAVATQRDLKDQETVLRRDIKDAETRLQAEITALSSRIDLVEMRLGGHLDTLKAELGTELRYIKWLGGVIVGALVALLVKAFFWT
jgi:hypothetical protein